MVEVDSGAHEIVDEAYLRAKKCIDECKSFVFEAGAGSGKTYSLVQCLKYIINDKAISLRDKGQRIACITYTNVAKNEIEDRTDSHPCVYASTIHSFCWSLMCGFQSEMRTLLPSIGKWAERIEEFEGGFSNQAILYDLGWPSIDENLITLHHDDVLALAKALLEKQKFQRVVYSKYPIIFIDEYQDTDQGFMEAILSVIEKTENAILLGLFGDHWQRIYGSKTCGKVSSPSLEVINKQSNFRSAKPVVEVLNRIRPDLLQLPEKADLSGEVRAFHTNGWNGVRRTGSHWSGDLPAEDAHNALSFVKEELAKNGWGREIKILMLTHKLLASEQGYLHLAEVFPHSEKYIKREDPYMAFFIDVIEAFCDEYLAFQYGKAFSIMEAFFIKSQTSEDKRKTKQEVDQLIKIREVGNISDVIEFIDHAYSLKLPPRLIEQERIYREILEISLEERDDKQSKIANRRSELGEVSYKEVIEVSKFVNEFTPFSTNHGVKGSEFTNVLVVIGRGWNQYNFNQMLEWMSDQVPMGKEATFERNRNLFYVACSRAKKRLSILFTQELSANAIDTLNRLFGYDNVFDIAESGRIGQVQKDTSPF